MAEEEMAEGGQVGGSKGGGPRGGGGGWLALLICKTANLRTLCLPALLFSFSTFSTTAFSSYGGPTRSFSPFPCLSLARPPVLSLSLASSISTHAVFLQRARFSTLTNTHTNPDCHSLALSPAFSPSPPTPRLLLRLTRLRSLIPAVRPVSSTYLL